METYGRELDSPFRGGAAYAGQQSERAFANSKPSPQDAPSDNLIELLNYQRGLLAELDEILTRTRGKLDPVSTRRPEVAASGGASVAKDPYRVADYLHAHNAFIKRLVREASSTYQEIDL